MTQDTTPMAGPGRGFGLLEPGTQFGAYRIVRLLGAGGMGQVYEAMHIALSKHVAIKVIVPEHASNREVVARFLREAQATARIRHPNVVDVTDVGEVNGTPFLVMEFLEGEPLSRCIRAKGALQAAEAVDLIIPVLAALEAAHEQNIIHRDIKPDNIFLVRERAGVRPTLVDFGISKLLDGGVSDGAPLTKTSLVVGTPYYMAPEQAHDSKRVDARADVYAIGVVLYEMLAGAVPFSGDSLMSILLQIAQGDYPPIGQRRPDIPEGLAHAVGMAMAIQSRNRFASASDFARALLPFATPMLRARYEREFRSSTAFETEQTGAAIDVAGVYVASSVSSAVPTPTARWENQDDVRTKPEVVRDAALAARASSYKPYVFAALGFGAMFVLVAGVGVLAKVFVLDRAPREVALIDRPPSSTIASPPQPPSSPRENSSPVEAPPPKVGQIERTEHTNDVAPPPVTTERARPQRAQTIATRPTAAITPPVENAATATPEEPSHAQVSLRFSGACSPRFNGRVRVSGSESAIVVSSIDGMRMTGVASVAACRGSGRYEAGSIEAAQRGFSVSIGVGTRIWTAIPNIAAQPGELMNSGTVQVSQINCNAGTMDVRFNDVVLVSPQRETSCTVNGTIRTTGFDD